MLEMPATNIVRSALDAALNLLCQPSNDAYLLQIDASERSITHRLAIHLESEVETWGEHWNVDCEYNRDANADDDFYKKIINATEFEVRYSNSIDGEHTHFVFPDIIVHKRDTEQNLLIVEIKKSTSKDAGAFDRKVKIPAYVEQLKYQFAAFVELKIYDPIGYKIVEWVERDGG